MQTTYEVVKQDVLGMLGGRQAISLVTGMEKLLFGAIKTIGEDLTRQGVPIVGPALASIEDILISKVDAEVEQKTAAALGKLAPAQSNAQPAPAQPVDVESIVSKVVSAIEQRLGFKG